MRVTGFRLRVEGSEASGPLGEVQVAACTFKCGPSRAAESKGATR